MLFRSTNRFSVKNVRAEYWISSGAQPTDSVHNILVEAKVIDGKKRSVHGTVSKKSDSVDKNTKEKGLTDSVDAKQEIDNDKENEVKSDEGKALNNDEEDKEVINKEVNDDETKEDKAIEDESSSNDNTKENENEDVEQPKTNENEKMEEAQNEEDTTKTEEESKDELQENAESNDAKDETKAEKGKLDKGESDSEKT